MENELRVRPFEESDRMDAVSLWEACGLTRPWNNPDKDISRKLAVQPELFFIGELGGKLIATAMAGYDGHRGSVFYLAVSPAYQRCGFGKLMMKHIEDELESVGCPKLSIIVRSSNEKVLSFYRALGYTTDDVISTGKRLIPDD
ncbi:MAG TPA: GNAT family acetyltransferase [Alcanivorax sp.]|nr:GNAT family acetyltransferase [Alcanivorax sp.]